MKIFGKTLDAHCTSAAKFGGLFGMAILISGSLLIGTEASAKDAAFIQSVAASPPPSGARQLCRQYSWACAHKSISTLSISQEMQLVKEINRRVNRSTREVTDQSQYKTRELWALPTSRGGDCEDFALLKKRDLIQAGLDPRKLLLATVLDTRRNSHAVLIYRSSHGDLVLDNVTNQIKPWKATRYLFLRMQDPKQPAKWLGVYGKS